MAQGFWPRNLKICNEMVLVKLACGNPYRFWTTLQRHPLFFLSFLGNIRFSRNLVYPAATSLGKGIISIFWCLVEAFCLDIYNQAFQSYALLSYAATTCLYLLKIAFYPLLASSCASSTFRYIFTVYLKLYKLIMLEVLWYNPGKRSSQGLLQAD